MPAILTTYDIFDNVIFYIPNAANLETKYDEIRENLDDCIDLVEQDYIKLFMGVVAYDELVAELEKEEPSSEATELQSELTPIIAGLVYYWYRRQNATQTNTTAETIAEGAVSPAQKMVTAWNRSVKLMEDLSEEVDGSEVIIKRINTWGI